MTPTPIKGDRRALRYVLTRVLIVVVRNSSQDGVINISMEPRDDGLAVVIEAAAEATAAEPAAVQSADDAEAKVTEDANAISARLALAHTLIQAHGGRLEVETRPGLGMRATVFLPRARLTGAARAA